MSWTSWHALGTELRRGTAPFAAVAFAVAGGVMLGNEVQDWAGRWLPLAEYIRVMLIVLCPLAVAAGAWQAGRERRRRMADQWASTPRPRWQAVVTGWVAVTVGIFVGMLLAWGVAAVLVARVASHAGPGWPLTLVVAFAGLAAASALGVLLGRVIPGRLVAPVAGVLAYVGIGVSVYEGESRGAMLVPTLGAAGSGLSSLAAGLQLWQLLWLGALAAVLVLLVAARRKWLAVLPAVLAAVAAWGVVSWPEDEHRVPDVAARELVCADVDGPEVCLARVNAFLLDDAAPAVRQRLARWDGVDGGFVRAVDARLWYDTGRFDVSDGTIAVDLIRYVSWNGRLTDTDPWGYDLDDEFAQATTLPVQIACDRDWTGDEPYYAAMEIAAGWARGGTPMAGVALEGREFEPPVIRALLDRPEEEQKAWMSRYHQAARTCDTAVLTALVEELR